MRLDQEHRQGGSSIRPGRLVATMGRTGVAPYSHPPVLRTKHHLNVLIEIVKQNWQSIRIEEHVSAARQSACLYAARVDLACNAAFADGLVVHRLAR